MKKPQTAHDIAEHFVLRAENKFVRDYEKALAKGQPAQLQSIEYVVVEMMAKEILRLRNEVDLIKYSTEPSIVDYNSLC